MYKAVRMFHYNDGIELERKALEGVCEVEEHVGSTEGTLSGIVRTPTPSWVSSSR